MGGYVVNNTAPSKGGAGGEVPNVPGRSASKSRNAYAGGSTMLSASAEESSSSPDERVDSGVPRASIARVSARGHVCSSSTARQFALRTHRRREHPDTLEAYVRQSRRVAHLSGPS
jgi:hypothetical protein